MKLYKFSSVDYEDWRDYYFSHTDKTQEQFSNDCKAIILKYVDEYIEQEKSWVTYFGILSYCIPKLTELGYEKLEFIQDNLNLNGDDIIDEDSDSDRNFYKLLHAEVIEKSIKHNIELENKIFIR